MSKLGAIQDLVHGIERILGQKEITEKDKLLNKVIEEQKQKMEEERQKAEARHQKKAYWQKNKKKYMVAGIIAVILVIVAAVGIPLNNHYLKPKKQYAAAVETLNNATLENGGFETALSEFEKLGDFLDSKSMVSQVYYKWAIAALESGNLYLVEKYSEKIEDPYLSNELTQYCYTRAEKALEEGSLGEAMRLMGMITDASLKNEIAYKISLAQIENKQYKAALDILINIKDYNDAEKLFNECCEKIYSEIEEKYYNQGELQKAYNEMKPLGSYYPKAKERANEIGSEIANTR